MTRLGFNAHHWNDGAGNPAGGATYGTGFTISWQAGPLGDCTCRDRPEGVAEAAHEIECKRKRPNGAFVEDIIGAAINRIEYYQGSRFHCDENEQALEHLRRALSWLEERTKAREARGVEGTHGI